jgi:hypothetical protein
MLLFETLTEENLLLFAAKNYYNPKCIDAEEFYEDFNRIKYIKKLLKKYEQSGVLSERLILNHIIVFFNVFGIEPSLRMLEYKLEENYWPVVKPFLILLRYITNEQYTNVEMDKNVIDILRQI